ncbi:restriction endonuclease subunit S, partial [Phascolarctobacterium succinatutens]
MREMKDSGIEWIGEIPKDWERARLKDYFCFEKGKNAQMYTIEYIGRNEGVYPVYSGQTENNGVMGKINKYDYDVDECLFTTTVGAKVMTPKYLTGKFCLSQNCLI